MQRRATARRRCATIDLPRGMPHGLLVEHLLCGSVHWRDVSIATVCDKPPAVRSVHRENTDRSFYILAFNLCNRELIIAREFGAPVEAEGVPAGMEAIVRVLLWFCRALTLQRASARHPRARSGPVTRGASTPEAVTQERRAGGEHSAVPKCASLARRDWQKLPIPLNEKASSLRTQGSACARRVRSTEGRREQRST